MALHPNKLGSLSQRFPRQKKAVHDLLKSLGVENPTKVSCCLKAGIMNGYVKLLAPENDPEGEFGLDQV